MSSRPRRAAASLSRRAILADASDDDEGASGSDASGSRSGGGKQKRRFADSDESDSADEWRPAAATAAPDGVKGKRARPTRQAQPSASASASASASTSASASASASGSASPGASESDVADARATGASAAASKSGAAAGKRKRASAHPAATSRSQRAKGNSASGSISRPATTRKRGARGVAEGEESDAELLAAAGAFEAEMEAAELEAAREEAKLAWQSVKARKNGGATTSAQGSGATSAATPSCSASVRVENRNGVSSSSTSTSTTAPRQGDLNVWLGKSAVAMPSTCAAAQIYDRDSLFIGHVYPLLSSSSASRFALLEHLSRAVHPRLATDAFPPAFRHLPPGRRGASHDMLAWRVLELKQGRDGLGGPGDFGVVEGEEDDGEKGGGRAVAKMLKGLGACDVLVVVSRWYGGTMLGPIRFQHIETCAREAILKYMHDEALVPLRTRLQSLDLRVGELRASLAALAPAASTSQSGASASQAAVAAASYADLTPSKAQRLISAREKQVDMLQTRLAQLGGEGADGDVGAKDAAPQEGCRREEKEKDGEVRVDLEQLDAAQRALRVLPP